MLLASLMGLLPLTLLALLNQDVASESAASATCLLQTARVPVRSSLLVESTDHEETRCAQLLPQLAHMNNRELDLACQSELDSSKCQEMQTILEDRPWSAKMVEKACSISQDATLWSKLEMLTLLQHRRSRSEAIGRLDTALSRKHTKKQPYVEQPPYGTSQSSPSNSQNATRPGSIAAKTSGSNTSRTPNATNTSTSANTSSSARNASASSSSTTNSTGNGNASNLTGVRRR